MANSALTPRSFGCAVTRRPRRRSAVAADYACPREDGAS